MQGCRQSTLRGSTAINSKNPELDIDGCLLLRGNPLNLSSWLLRKARLNLQQGKVEESIKPVVTRYTEGLLPG